MNRSCIFENFKRLVPRSFVRFAAPGYHLFLAAFAAARYGFPSRRMTVIGVTGTNGKTTVVHLLHEFLTSTGHRVGSVSSLRFKIGDRETPNLLKMTMPGRFRLQAFLAECRSASCRFAIIEVTSQGILRSRHRFISFHAAVLTQITPEHIEAHGGFEAYRDAKLKLFTALPQSGIAVINVEDPAAELFARRTPAAVVRYSCSAVEFAGETYPLRLSEVTTRRIRLEVGGVSFESRLGGVFNAMNIIAATATAMALGVPLPAIRAALSRISGVPGRLEYLLERPFAVVVDYAVTPDALEQVYRELSDTLSEIRSPIIGDLISESAERRLVCVFGSAGGGRDKWKRPALGEIASRYCRQIVLTSDDPDDEDPVVIAADIHSGIPAGTAAVEVVVDRQAAIRRGIALARPGDTVVITGMGAQPWLVVGGREIPWDEREIVRTELTRRTSSQGRFQDPSASP